MGKRDERCRSGVPWAAHRKCAVCGLLMGCSGEAQPARFAPLLCSTCYDEGARLRVFTARAAGPAARQPAAG